MSTEVSIRKSSLPAQVRESGVQLSPDRIRVLSAMEGKPIRDYDAESYVRTINNLLPYVMKDVGIRGTPSEYDLVRTADYLRQYWPEFSLEEVKQAFEYLISGLLDEYLPEDPYHLKHFGEWSIAYLSKVLRAYKVLRSRTVIDVRRLLPDPADRPVTEEEKKKIVRDFTEFLLERILQAQKGGDFPRHLFSAFVHKILVDLGLGKELPEPTEAEIRESLSMVLSDETLPPTYRSDIRRRYTEEKKIDSFLLVRVGNDKARKAIEAIIRETSEKKILEKLATL